MALPFCIDLTLVMMLSVVCQADDGTVVDLREYHIDIEPVNGFGLFSTPSQTTKSFSSITTDISSSSNSNNNENDNSNNENHDDNTILPYCDKVNGQRDKYATCHDRQDYDDSTGLARCNDGSNERDYRDCQDSFDYDEIENDDKLDKLEHEIDEMVEGDNDEEDKNHPSLNKLDDEIEEMTD